MRAGLLAVLLASVPAVPGFAETASESPVGLYDGHQMEIGAHLELSADGRYRYELSYGALDEWSAGTWVRDGESIVLTSDPFTPPAFDIREDGKRTGSLAIRMDLPDGFDAQYFWLKLVHADGSSTFESMTRDGLDIPMGDNPVVSLQPILPVMDLMGPTVAVPSAGAALRIAFKPNDLGVAGFDHERLPRNGDAYELARHGRTIRFRKVDTKDEL